MYRHTIILIVSSLILSACAGGLSGIMTSSVPGQWLLYKITYPESAKRFDPSPEGRLDHLVYNESIIEKLLLVDLGYKMKQGWHSPLLANAHVATFKQKYRGNYINLDVEISLEKIIIMSTSYSSDTKKAFDNLESALKEIFGETNVEKCFDTKTLYGHDCFGNI